MVSGHFLNGASLPIGGALVQLQVFDDAHAQIGKPVPLVVDLETRTSLDGSFIFRLATSAELKAFAATNGDFVNFQVFAVDEGSGATGLWAFPRKIVGDGWEGLAPTVTLRSNGQSSQP